MTETKDMFEQISAILTDKKDKPFSYEELAAMLKTDPDALKTFDEVYKTQVLESGELRQQPRLNRFAGYRRGLRGNP